MYKNLLTHITLFLQFLSTFVNRLVYRQGRDMNAPQVSQTEDDRNGDNGDGTQQSGDGHASSADTTTENGNDKFCVQQ